MLAADHLVADQAAFQQAIVEDIDLAGKLVTFGIQLDAPETGYGYIESDGNRELALLKSRRSKKPKNIWLQGVLSGIQVLSVLPQAPCWNRWRSIAQQSCQLPEHLCISRAWQQETVLAS